MLMRIFTTTVLVGTMAILSACAPAGGPPTSASSSTPEGPQSSQDRAVEAAKKDLAQKKGITPESISVADVTQVDWPDTSLGCPQPGMMYAQMITPGYKIILSAGGDNYEYHSDLAGNRVVSCEGK